MIRPDGNPLADLILIVVVGGALIGLCVAAWIYTIAPAIDRVKEWWRRR